jgi:hypothetical protein
MRSTGRAPVACVLPYPSARTMQRQVGDRGLVAGLLEADSRSVATVIPCS